MPSSHAIEAPVHVPVSALGPPLGLKSTWMLGGRPVPEETEARTVQGGPSASSPLTTAAVAFAMMERGQPGWFGSAKWPEKGGGDGSGDGGDGGDGGDEGGVMTRHAAASVPAPGECVTFVSVEAKLCRAGAQPSAAAQ